MTSRLLQLNPADQVAVALADIEAGAELGWTGLRARQTIPYGHKVALAPISTGETIRKFGQPIGVASSQIYPGEHVHLHNLIFNPGAPRQLGETLSTIQHTHPDQVAFMGILRDDGRVATRNYIGILTTVNCSSTPARLIADYFRRPSLVEQYPHVDGVIALTHKGGCTSGEDSDATLLLQRTLGGYARHPNFAAVLVVGLGCEDNQVSRLFDQEALAMGNRLYALNIQESGGTRGTVRAGVEWITALLPAVNDVERIPLPASHLILGLQCGGSDGFSGLTANPALGVAADLLIKHGGTAILSETPEIYGAEHLLLSRAANQEVSDKLMDLLAWWEQYTAAFGETLDSNPSPGNKAGGITTILEKSLGAVMKSGQSNLMDVLQYAQQVKSRGLVFMDTPGYDPVSVTGQVAGGANIVCFTTGRGSAFGCRPVPSLKLASNTPLFERMPDDIDINCGEILAEKVSLEEMGEKIFAMILATASGAKTKSELWGYGEDEFAPWHIGATI
ncbi:MAG: altronate dehydratase family protein [Chloroflexi bacterium]|nr:altronate dehydratase family protein [Chloroflexota bacterium]